MKVGDKVKYGGEAHLVVGIIKDGSPVVVPMSNYWDLASFVIDLDELE